MCWVPVLVEFPTIWKDDGQDNFAELGIEPSTHKGMVLLDVKSIVRMNEAHDKTRTTVDINDGGTWIIDLPLDTVKTIVSKCGVEIKTVEEVYAL